MQKNLLWYRVLIIAITILQFRSANGQQPVDYSYLKKCFSNSPVDSFEIEVKNMGELMSCNIEGDSTLDVLLTYFPVPGDKMNMKLSKIATLAAQRQQDTWKNNSKLVYYKKTEKNNAVIIDYRLYILIEDIYMQVIVICNKGWVYELDCFRDTNETAYFDDLTRKIMARECL